LLHRCSYFILLMQIERVSRHGKECRQQLPSWSSDRTHAISTG
jgi:hypothetical protein